MAMIFLIINNPSVNFYKKLILIIKDFWQNVSCVCGHRGFACHLKDGVNAASHQFPAAYITLTIGENPFIILGNIKFFQEEIL